MRVDIRKRLSLVSSSRRLDACVLTTIVCKSQKDRFIEVSECLPVMSQRYTKQNRIHVRHKPSSSTLDLVVIWVHPPGGPGWGGARDLDFLIKESIMRIQSPK